MILALDIGNTGVKFALADAGELARVERVSLSGLESRDFELCLSEEECAAIQRVVGCSVNPGALEIVRKSVEQCVGKPLELAGEDFPYGIRAKVDTPGAVGADRLMAALGAYRVVGGACFVVDFGSAVTVDVVSEEGDFLGGAIAAGLGFSAKALAEWTAFLPLVEPAKPSAALGKDTRQAMTSGLYYGHAGMVDRLVEALAAEVGWPKKIIATGGDAYLVAPACNCVDEVHPHLTLQGLLVASGEARD